MVHIRYWFPFSGLRAGFNSADLYVLLNHRRRRYRFFAHLLSPSLSLCRPGYSSV